MEAVRVLPDSSCNIGANDLDSCKYQKKPVYYFFMHAK